MIGWASDKFAIHRVWRSVGIAIGAVFVIGVLLPSSPDVEREAIIDARPATVFWLLNDFRQVNEWSPYSEDDPNARIIISGPPSGVGASISWSGRIIGQRRQTITESVPFERIVSDEGTTEAITATHTISLGDEDGRTRVSWRWQRHFGLNLAGRYFGLLLDGIRGPELEKDLARLAAMAERLPPADFSDIRIEHIFVESTDIAYVTTTSRPQAEAVTSAMSDSFFDILDFIRRNGLTEAGAPLSITRNFSGGNLVFDAAIPIRGLSDTTPRTGPTVRIGTTYEGPVIRARHVGAYATLGRTHDKIAAYLAARGIARNGDAWESYVSDPGRTDESGLITYIYYPIRN
jgi:effector-binding domain-containing protein